MGHFDPFLDPFLTSFYRLWHNVLVQKVTSKSTILTPKNDHFFARFFQKQQKHEMVKKSFLLILKKEKNTVLKKPEKWVKQNDPKTVVDPRLPINRS